jgi:hypothetical protein
MHTIQVCILFAAPVQQYTDDSAMAKCIAESLIAQERFDALDLSKRWGVSYSVLFALQLNKVKT